MLSICFSLIIWTGDCIVVHSVSQTLLFLLWLSCHSCQLLVPSSPRIISPVPYSVYICCYAYFVNMPSGSKEIPLSISIILYAFDEQCQSSCPAFCWSCVHKLPIIQIATWCFCSPCHSECVQSRHISFSHCSEMLKLQLYARNEWDEMLSSGYCASMSLSVHIRVIE